MGKKLHLLSAHYKPETGVLCTCSLTPSAFLLSAFCGEIEAQRGHVTHAIS